MKLRNLVLSSALIVAPAALFAQSITATPPNRHQIAERKTDQQQRIAQGVRSGQLNARETGRLEHQEARINREERAMRALDNGHLTRSDRKRLTRQQNRESRRIYNQKHDAQTR